MTTTEKATQVKALLASLIKRIEEAESSVSESKHHEEIDETISREVSSVCFRLDNLVYDWKYGHEILTPTERQAV